MKRERHGYARLHAILDSVNEGVLMYALDGQVHVRGGQAHPPAGGGAVHRLGLIQTRQ